jgi:hypothetical protein
MSTVPESLRNYRFELVEAIDRELERELPLAASRRLGRRAALAGAVVVAVALLALTFAEPWHGGPTAIDRAEAALLAPAGGQILYESVSVRLEGRDAPERVTRVRLWIDSATHRFRLMFSGLRPAVVGGTLGSSRGLNYMPSANALYRAAFQFRIRQSDLDPAAFLKEALRSGRAKLRGKGTIHGHEVIVIQLSTWFNGTVARLLKPIALYYVDADTYRPVRVVAPPPDGPVVMLPPGAARSKYVGPENLNGSRFGFPMDPGAFLAGFPGYTGLSVPGIPAGPVPRPKPYLVYDFDTYRLLAPTAANHRLTSVRAVYADVERYASGFRAASTPLFRALHAYGPGCLGVVHELTRCGRAIADVRAALPPLLRYVLARTPPASSLQWANADLRRLVKTLRALQRGFAALAALNARDDFVNPSRYTDWMPGFYKTISDLQVDIPELRLRF